MSSDRGQRWLLRLFAPLCLTVALALLGTRLLGGSLWLWLLGAWLLNVPVTLTWNLLWKESADSRTERP